jgi:lysophospholipase L1-like esterase
MKPIKISGFLVVILTVILLIPFLFSESKISIFNYTLRIPKKSIYNQQTKPQYKDITELKTLLADTTEIQEKSEPEIKAKVKKDTIAPLDKKIANPVKSDSIRNIIQPLEFPENQDTLLAPFFATLKTLEQSYQLIRILHYGDSQIEADRITSYFRNQMQKQFGGGGVGLIPVTPVNPASISYVYDISPNWSRYSILNTKKKDGEPDYGILGCFSRFSSREVQNEKETEAWIFLKNPNITYSKAGKFNKCKLLLGLNRSPLFIELKKNDIVLDADILPSGSNFRVIDWTVETGSRNLKITLKGKDSPDLYGIALDSDKGIAVDNIPLRGSSGLEFTRIYKSPYHKVLDKLNVKLIILQFGVNAVINMSKNIGSYEKMFQRQLSLLRLSQPDIPIIIIGVSDISKNTPEGYVTNEAVEKIRDAQKRAAFNSGCVFWDMYQGMGGENSMPSWVFAKPSLAQKDFIHLNPLGARIIGEMFYRSLMNEYEKYLLKTNNDE